MLLSSAQFEREVTSERIRDKIAASKKKGLWMGGPVPLGYEVRDRKLVVHEGEADLVRHIMRRYLALGSVRELIDELRRDGHRTKRQVRTSGPHRGGAPFRRGTLYHLLANRIYRGEIVHKGRNTSGRASCHCTEGPLGCGAGATRQPRAWHDQQERANRPILVGRHPVRWAWPAHDVEPSCQRRTAVPLLRHSRSIG